MNPINPVCLTANHNSSCQRRDLGYDLYNVGFWSAIVVFVVSIGYACYGTGLEDSTEWLSTERVTYGHGTGLVP